METCYYTKLDDGDDDNDNDHNDDNDDDDDNGYVPTR